MEASQDSKAAEFFGDEGLKTKPEVEEDGRYKKQNSYTYWVKDNKEMFPQHKDTTLIQPKKIECPELLKQLTA